MDANHGEIKRVLEQCGWTVIDTSRLGDGFPDVLAVRGGRIELIEVKDGAKPLSAQKATRPELRLYDKLARAGVRVRYINDVAQIAEL